MSQGSKGAEAENPTNPVPPDTKDPSPDNWPSDSDAIAAQRHSIWRKYVKIATKWDQQMMGRWETTMNNLLLFAALFTAIVTSFTLDALSDLNEDTSTKLLRILAEQATAGQGIAIPGPDIDPSTMAVCSLWLLSIVSSLAATTWAVLSLAWCSFLRDDVQTEGYEDMAEKRQLKFETVKRWKIHLAVAALPFLLHASMFFFLAGLWLRMRGVDSQLGFIVGVPSVIIAVSYVIVTLLPSFTQAPLHTPVSEIAGLVVDEVRYLLRLRRFVHPPPIVTWTWSSFLSIFRKLFPRPGPVYRKHLHPSILVAANFLLQILTHIYKLAGQFSHAAWKVVSRILWAVLPTFRPGGDPFMVLNRLSIGHSGRDKGVYQRALLWLMSTPLDQDEVKEILKAFGSLRVQGHAEEPPHRPQDRGKVEKPMDRALLKLLVSSLSSVLDDGQISKDEQPIFDHCTMLLTEEMDRTFRNSKHDPMILARDATVSSGLKEFVDVGTFPIPSPALTEAYSHYWKDVIRSLWLSPSEGQIRVIIGRLDTNVRSIELSLLRRVICGLHAATLTSLEAGKRQSILQFPLPDFSKWNSPDDELSGGWTIEGRRGGDYRPPNDHIALDEELLAFLRNLLTRFYKDAQPARENHSSPVTTPSLIIACTKLLDSRLHENVPLNFHNALCAFATITWRNSPGVFDTEPSMAQALVKSVKNLSADPGPTILKRSEKIAIRLRALTHGPKYTTSQQHTSPDTVASLYTGPVKEDLVCLSEFIHLTAAVLESVLMKETQPGAPDRPPPVDPRLAQNIVPPLFFADPLPFECSTANPDCRLPYLYAYAIALSRGIAGTGRNRLEVLNLLRGSDEQQGIAAIEKVLDANALAVIVLRHILPHRPRRVAEEDLRTCLGAVTCALRPLQGIINRRDVDSWRTRWKAIYLLADIRNILPEPLAGFGELESLIDEASGAVRTYILELPQNEHVPKDWDMKREGLLLCGLDGAVGELGGRNKGAVGVYSRRGPGNIPYLSLYPQGIRPGRSQAARRLLGKLRWLFSAGGSATTDPGNPTPENIQLDARQ